MASRDGGESPRAGSIFGAHHLPAQPKMALESVTNPSLLAIQSTIFSSQVRASSPQRPSFSCFRLLPPEIRLQIWSLNFPTPRVVKVHYDVKIGKFYTSTPLPANLLICKESRNELLNEWTPHFGTLGYPPSVRVNWNIDTVQLDWDPLRLKVINQSDLARMVHLEVGGKELQEVPAACFLAAVLQMPNLLDLTIISPPPHQCTLDLYMAQPPYVESDEEQHWFIIAQRLAYAERRMRAFSTHMEFCRSFRRWARENPESTLPTLRLIVTEIDGSRWGPVYRRP